MDHFERACLVILILIAGLALLLTYASIRPVVVDGRVLARIGQATNNQATAIDAVQKKVDVLEREIDLLERESRRKERDEETE